ncbi:putative enoyl-[acyl-carrier-protein] reductase [NADH] [Halobacteriovorax marinus SJ]|uniref:Enoyl-[acyl-carrier-protein] reductase [NADH] n=1 Tax=Halobacteriovorax marinus (strain ATCC BAA-682 / DSM 15412 / SJ) TaxID=862908 RepID=E1X069_HALMS|nr:SDR family oxidoreductase [Halobacteriovorax marinus]CBW26296.1 putative enoyl-[acyl-carrier-protein] reductase [NADH] [Halobacteriovorax marinus SJ]
MDFGFKNKNFVISGVANRKSVAYFVAKSLSESGANLILTVQSEDHLTKVQKLIPEALTYIVDVENSDDISNFGKEISKLGRKIDGFLHSIAFANYSEGIKPFHETKLEDYLQATNISSFSLVALSNTLRPSFSEDASIVTVSISDTRATSYGYMGPIKASLDATVAYLAKSLSAESRIRCNAVCAGPLKTSASAGIPGYINNYLFAQSLTLRKENLKTAEVANTISFLLSSLSSGINATGIKVDAGMSCNHFDADVVNTVANNL